MDAVDLSAAQRLGKNADYRHDGGDCCLEADLATPGLSSGPELRAVAAQQLLIGANDRQPCIERSQHVFTSRLGAAHHFNDQVGLGDDRFGVALAASQYTADDRASAGQPCDVIGALFNQLSESCADRATAEQADLQQVVRHRAPADHRCSHGARQRARRRCSRRSLEASKRRCSCWPSHDRTPLWPEQRPDPLQPAG
ncbi:unannotated protein [freshwater metagenome]|uniref:Unannotated protein n=1 Tax=freshwater metagenome TaxID=449393 RepID=A0A6J5ZUJ7_9ZZZZ